MSRSRIAVLFGGMSEEHPVSVKSAREVQHELNLARYDPSYVRIGADGAWRLCAGPDDASTGRPVTLSVDRSAPGLLVEEDDGRRTRLPIDVVLPVLHGRFGEDGAIQGLLELSGIPYVGCDVPGSALCMDKSLAYLVVGAAGIPVPRFRTIGVGGPIDVEGLAFPVFVKPARSGSSFGVTRVDRPEDLAAAVDEARRYDEKVLVEEAVVGAEVGCAVLEGDDGLIVGEVDQIRLTHGFFRIHQEDAPEIRSENSSVVVPAEIPAEARARVQRTARAVYRALGCRGLARVDLFLREDGADGEIVLNEVNTLPGLTSYSRYPRMMAAAGIPLAEVLDRLIAFAREGARR
jgi:D-alanine---(R)-lactate ligase